MWWDVVVIIVPSLLFFKVVLEGDVVAMVETLQHPITRFDNEGGFRIGSNSKDQKKLQNRTIIIVEGKMLDLRSLH
jgi:hypothetical protein